MMNKFPHVILPEKELTRESKYRFTPLTEGEQKQLAGMSPFERADWARANLPTKERLARYLESEGVASWVVNNARAGRYDDFDDGGAKFPQIEAVKGLRSIGRVDIVKLIIDGEFDSTKRESDAWAAKQTGEVANILNIKAFRGE